MDPLNNEVFELVAREFDEMAIQLQNSESVSVNT